MSAGRNIFPDKQWSTGDVRYRLGWWYIALEYHKIGMHVCGYGYFHGLECRVQYTQLGFGPTSGYSELMAIAGDGNGHASNINIQDNTYRDAVRSDHSHVRPRSLGFSGEVLPVSGLPPLAASR